MQNYPIYQSWLDQGFNSGMSYLESAYHKNTRLDPHNLMPDVQSIICLGYPYPLHSNEMLNITESALVAGYASGIDYHLDFPKLLGELIDYLKESTPVNITSRIYSDSAPILERELACRAGLGWIGKNSSLISPDYGSTFLLAEIFTTLPLSSDPPFELDRCGSCRRCIDACPTACINDDRTIDASRCISYHTIENKNVVPEDIAKKIGNWLFGCDVCQMVCPWNQKIKHSAQLQVAQVFSLEELINFLTVSEGDFKSQFHQSPLLRAKWKRLMRNVLIVLSGSTSSLAFPTIQHFIQSNSDPELLSLAKWALTQLTKNPL